MKKQYKLAVVIGRFAPLHLGHCKLIDEAFSIAEEVLVLVGSAYQARTIKNPFSFYERESLIQDYISSLVTNPDINLVFNIESLRDNLYDDRSWFIEVNSIIKKTYISGFDDSITPINNYKQIALVGFKKDKSSYYLSNFKDYSFVEIDPLEGIYPTEGEYRTVNSTNIRNDYFEDGYEDRYDIPMFTETFLHEFKKTDEYKTLQQEYNYIKQYKKETQIGKFPTIFTTTDSVVIHKGKVLVIKRKGMPGKGLYALPGGFLKYDEQILDGALRELKEETKIKVHKNVLKRYLEKVKCFDHPDRSLRGRTITFAHYFNLDEYEDKIEIKAGSDASGVFWLPLDELSNLEDKFFEDHLHIIKYFI